MAPQAADAVSRRGERTWSAGDDAGELVYAQDRQTVQPIVHDLMRRFQTW